MPSENFYNKEMIDLYHDGLKRDIEVLKGMIHEVHKKQDYTNGRVTKNEKFVWASIGGLAVITSMIVPLLLKLL